MRLSLGVRVFPWCGFGQRRQGRGKTRQDKPRLTSRQTGGGYEAPSLSTVLNNNESVVFCGEFEVFSSVSKRASDIPVLKRNEDG